MEAVQLELCCSEADAVTWINGVFETIIEALEDGESVDFGEIGFWRARKYPTKRVERVLKYDYLGRPNIKITETVPRTLRARVRCRTNPRASWVVVESTRELWDRMGGRLIYLVPRRRLFQALQLKWLRKQGLAR
jgi:hypothetical protein